MSNIWLYCRPINSIKYKNIPLDIVYSMAEAYFTIPSPSKRGIVGNLLSDLRLIAFPNLSPDD